MKILHVILALFLLGTLAVPAADDTAPDPSLLDLPDMGVQWTYPPLFEIEGPYALHVVRWGDTWSEIARSGNVPSRELARLNPGLQELGLKPGQTLRVPFGDSETAAPRVSDFEISRGLAGRMQICLTFDCGWATRKDLDKLLATLDDLNVCATFFLTGIFLDNAPDAAWIIHEAGHDLGNHSRSHPHFSKLAAHQMQDQLISLEERVRQSATKKNIELSTRPFWRAPYGDRDQRILHATAQIGFQSIGWTIDSRDWYSDPPATVDTVFEEVCVKPFQKNPGKALDGAIVLMHLAAEPTNAALKKIVPFLREKGYTFATLEEALNPNLPPLKEFDAPEKP